ncbi:TRAP transporter substrate-binding protein [Rhizobium sp. CFBP 8762]|uniref:TRAP transporter substrate-binding protein n=1 Tax=Rhizobium sp. CFBP 8762 TaxID=2775279 RepID=UPI00177F1835|nr:TRAP transporter substrate-binding protein [Rhizobium sp. CFBP 8762]MBD8556090.1 TRAP transporter substrate-binding protein [Rhizobium sp. CFBP 8762]
MPHPYTLAKEHRATRRSFLSLAAAAITVPFVSQAHASPALTKVLKLGLSNGKGAQTDQMAQEFGRELSRLCGGSIRVEIYFGGALGGEKEMSEDLAAGTLDLAIASSAGYAAKTIAPKLGVFDTPFLFRDLQHARAVLDGPIGEQALRDLYPAGIVGLCWGENGLRQVTTRDRPVRTPADLAGLKIRVPQSEVMVTAFKAFGADAQPMPFPDLYAALADGSFQAQENPVGNIKNANFDRVQTYLSITNHVYSPVALMVAKRTFDALTAEEQEAMMLAAKSAAPVSRQVNDKTEKADIKELERRGMTVITDVDRPAFVAAIQKSRSQFESMFGKTTLDAIQTFGS